MDTSSMVISKESVKLSDEMLHHKCPVCPHSSTSQAGLMCHLTTKHNERLVAVCKICQQIFTSDAIGPHVLVCKGSYSCPYCRATFALPSYLQRHISRRHKISERPNCEVCRKNFSSTNALAVHKRLHEGRFPYTCRLCSANFAQKNHLKLHLDSHHAYVELDAAPKPFVCKTCGRGFLFTVSIQQHRLQHCKTYSQKLLPCKVCTKTFTHRSELQRHSAIHSKCSSYQCSFCPRSFTRANLLRSHILLHTDPSLLTCCYCSRTYASRSYLLQHIERHEQKMQAPSICSLSTTSISELEMGSLDDCEASVPKEISEVWEELAFTDFGSNGIVSPDELISYLLRTVYWSSLVRYFCGILKTWFDSSK
ncbi:unnamed protein product [Heterobilharzia americana]|nr:unnamed protein product [Heterobilharzia americana]CAH8647435.1 unnamed protein product [Heterobilharzia americana]